MGKENKIGVISIDPTKDRAVKLKGWDFYTAKIENINRKKHDRTKLSAKTIRSIIDANTKSKLRQTIKRIPGVSALMEKRSPPYAKMSWPSLSSLSQKRKIKTIPGRRSLRKPKRKTVRYPNENSKNKTPKTKGGSWIY